MLRIAHVSSLTVCVSFFASTPQGDVPELYRSGRPPASGKPALLLLPGALYSPCQPFCSDRHERRGDQLRSGAHLGIRLLFPSPTARRCSRLHHRRCASLRLCLRCCRHLPARLRLRRSPPACLRQPCAVGTQPVAQPGHAARQRQQPARRNYPAYRCVQGCQRCYWRGQRRRRRVRLLSLPGAWCQWRAGEPAEGGAALTSDHPQRGARVCASVCASNGVWGFSYSHALMTHERTSVRA